MLSGDNIPEIFHVAPRATDQPQGNLAGTNLDVPVETSKAAAETVLIGSEEEQPSSVQNMSIPEDGITGLDKLTPREDVSADVQDVDSETEGK